MHIGLTSALSSAALAAWYRRRCLPILITGETDRGIIYQKFQYVPEFRFQFFCTVQLMKDKTLRKAIKCSTPKKYDASIWIAVRFFSLQLNNLEIRIPLWRGAEDAQSEVIGHHHDHHAQDEDQADLSHLGDLCPFHSHHWGYSTKCTMMIGKQIADLFALHKCA